MKLSVILISFVSLSFSYASSYAQETKLSLNITDGKLKEVFKSIESQSEFSFMYDNSMINVEREVSIKARNNTVLEVLDQVLDKKEIQYQIIDRHIVLLPTKQKEQDRTITGKVTSQEDNSGLPGVNVIVKGTTNGTVTDVEGNYSLEVSDGEVILAFSSVGYMLEEVKLGTSSIIDMVLTPDITALEEIVVIGYGSVKKSDLTGSVVSVKSDDFIPAVTNNAMTLMQGKASGVTISQANSEPGGAVSVRIRGAGSINSSNGVLYVIDGLPGADPINLDPNDIESIEILKDASAAAIYGTRAANGVVLITTKKGSGKPKVSFSTSAGLQQVDSKFDLLNATEYMQMLNDFATESGGQPPFTEEEINSAGEGTDWQDQLMRDAAVFNAQLALSGGTENAKHYVSLGYLNQDGVLVSSGLKKYNTLINMELNPGKKFKFGLNLAGTYQVKDIIPNSSDKANENADPLNAALQFDPTLSAERDENGEYEKNPTIALDNPVAMAYGYDDNEIRTLISGNAFLEYTIIDGLKAIGRIGSNLSNRRYDSYKDRTTKNGLAAGGIGTISSTNYNTWLFEALLSYNKSFNEDHQLGVVAGATWEKFQTLTQFSGAKGFLSDVTKTNLLSSGLKDTYDVNSSKTTRALQSFLARVNYTFKDRYLLTASLRRDGTSRFSETNKYAIFPSVSAAWRLNNEEFFNSGWVDQLKFRFGYGQSGNEGINNFETIQTFVAGNTAILGESLYNGARPARIPNSNLVWETTEMFNYGLDFGFFDHRISGSLEYFVKNTNDQLFNQPVAASTGFTQVRNNFGSVRNSGVELMLSTVNLTGDLEWITDFTFSSLVNEVTELPPYVGDIITTGNIGTFTGNFALVQEGYPMNAFYGYQVIGIFQEGDDIANSSQPNANPGDPIFFNADGDDNIDAEDRVVLGSPFPDYTFSLNNTFKYKNFDLSFYFLAVEGIKTLNSNIVESLSPINAERNILSKHYHDRWTPDNPGAKYPSGINSAQYFSGGKSVNSYTVQDASFVRLRNFTLGYNIPVSNSNTFSFFRVYVSGENLFTITDFDGFDPDANQSGTGVIKTAYNNYPLARTYRVGVNIEF